LAVALLVASPFTLLDGGVIELSGNDGIVFFIPPPCKLTWLADEPLSLAIDYLKLSTIIVLRVQSALALPCVHWPVTAMPAVSGDVPAVYELMMGVVCVMPVHVIACVLTPVLVTRHSTLSVPALVALSVPV
jgi:hypothetical protein